MSHIRNEDLSKMSDNELVNEIDYLLNQSKRIVVRLQIDIIRVTLKKTFSVPIWRQTEDLDLLTERLQMVMDEIEYRKIP